jgi:ATP-dependent DNA ligase
VVLQSRQQRWLTTYFPEVVTALREQLTEGVVLDGEIVVCCAGRLDFAALHRRLHVAGKLSAAVPPACFVVFDVLARGADDLRGLAYAVRRELVADMLRAVIPPLALMPMTTSEVGALTWLTDHVSTGIEGVVAKHAAHPYRPARKAWQKIRTRVTAEAVVGGVIGRIDAPEVLFLGLDDERGRLRVAGRTNRLPHGMRAEIGAVLEAPRHIHPWPTTISSSRFGQLPPQPVEYTPVDPAVVVELDADLAFEHGRWRHPTALLRIRSDLTPEDLPQLPR